MMTSTHPPVSQEPFDLRVPQRRVRQLLSVILAGLALSAMAAFVRAQNVPIPILSSPNIELTQAGLVRDVEKLPDGGWLVAGNFGRAGTINRPGIARLQADGSVDPSFVPTTSLSSSQIRRVAAGSAGRSYVQYTDQILALQSNGSTDPNFTSVRVSNGQMQALAVLDDGLLAGGSFTTVLTTPNASVSRLAKFGLNGAYDATFSMPTEFTITAIVPAGAGRAVVAGGFTSIGGQARTGLALINTLGVGSVDSNFQPTITNGVDRAFIEDATVVGDEVYIVGRFTAVNGIACSRAAKLSLLDGSLDTNWVLSIGGSTLNALTIDAQGSDVLISSGATQTYANPPAAGSTRLIAKVAQSNAQIDSSFNVSLQFEPGFTPLLRAAEGDAPTRTVIVGSFTQIGANTRFGLVQVDAQGQQDLLSAHGELSRAGVVRRLQFDAATSRTYLSGTFRRAGLAARSYVLRLNSSGVVDAAWRPAVNELPSPAIALAPGVGVFVAGTAGILKFDEVAGDPVPGWTNTTNASELVVGGGALFSLSGTQLLRIPLTGNGGSDPGFQATLGAQASSLQYDANGNTLLLVMQVAVPGGGNQLRLVRFDALTGTRLPAFDLKLETAAGVVQPQGYAVEGDGVWVAGNFTRINGVAQNSPARILLSNGQVDPAVAPNTGPTFNNGLGFHRGFFYGHRFVAGGTAEILRFPIAGGSTDATFVLPAIGSPQALVGDGLRLIVGGDFDRIGAGNTPRLGIAAALEQDRLLANGFE